MTFWGHNLLTLRVYHAEHTVCTVRLPVELGELSDDRVSACAHAVTWPAVIFKAKEQK